MNHYLTSRRKRVLDITAAIAGLFVLTVTAIPVAFLILLLDGWPVHYRQNRLGLDAGKFTIWKFRTMRDGQVFRGGRILRATHADEFPQWWNVLRGEMSAVGPRPHTLEDHFAIARTVPLWSVRLRAKPGITGLAQTRVHGTDFAGKLEWDLSYIANASLLGDIRLLARTLIPFRRPRVVSPTHETESGRLETHAD